MTPPTFADPIKKAHINSYLDRLIKAIASRGAKGSTPVVRRGASKPKNFYQSAEWKQLRYDALKASNGCCQLCGASPATRPGTVLNVDHIKPVSKFWALRLDPDNLQVLCGSCNHGKGSRDTTDWRPDDVFAEPSLSVLMGESVH